jgi:hypothetical protein
MIKSEPLKAVPKIETQPVVIRYAVKEPRANTSRSIK